MAPSSWERVIYSGTFRHAAVQEQIDEKALAIDDWFRAGLEGWRGRGKHAYCNVMGL